MRFFSKLSLILLFFTCNALSLWAYDVIHQPPRSVTFREPITLQLVVETSTSLTNVMMHYRSDPSAEFEKIPLSYEGADTFSLAFIPSIKSDTFEYYFEIYQTGVTQTLPETDPQQFPYQVSVSFPDLPKASFSDLYPEHNTLINENSFQLLMTVDDPAELIDLSTITLHINGKDQSASLSKSHAFLNGLITNLPNGNHELQVSAKDIIGRSIHKTVRFRIYPQDQPFFSLRGRTSYGFQSSDSNQEGGFLRFNTEQSLRTNINMTLQDLQLQLDWLEDSRDNPNAQPIDRLGFSVTDKAQTFKVNLQDSSPYFSDMTLNYLFVRGYDAKVNLFSKKKSKSGLVVRKVHGITQRKIPINAPAVTIGTYEQTINANQLQFNFPYSKNSLNYVRISDRLDSLSSPPSSNQIPVENHVISMVNDFRTLGSQIKLESAASVHYADTTAAEVTDTSQLELPLSDSMQESLLKTFPARSSLIVGYGFTGDLRRDIIPNKVILKADADYIAPGFTSLGNNSIQKDIYKLGGELSIRTWKNRASLSGGVFRQQNNILNAVDKTTFTDNHFFRGSVYIPNHGSYFMSYTATDRFSKLTDPENEVTSNLGVKNSLESLSVGVSGISFDSLDFDNSFNLNYAYTDYGDKIVTGSAFESHSGGIGLQTAISPYTMSMGINLSHNQAKGNTPNATLFVTYTGQLSVEAIPQRLQLTTGVDIGTGLNKGQDTSRHQDTRRTTYRIGLSYSRPNYHFLKSPRFSLNWSFSDSQDLLFPDDKRRNFQESIFSVAASSGF